MPFKIATKVEPKAEINRSQLGKRSKTKGANFERTIADVFQKKHNIELKRTPQSGGFAKKSEKAEEFRGDILPVEKDVKLRLHIECKNQKSWSLPSWLTQAEADCPKDRVPVVVFHKHNTSKNYITLSLDDFLELVPFDKIFERR